MTQLTKVPCRCPSCGAEIVTCWYSGLTSVVNKARIRALCGKDPLYCIEPGCSQPATHIHCKLCPEAHPYCEKHAAQSGDFPDGRDCCIWERIPLSMIAPERELPHEKEKVFVKVSGDLLEHPPVFTWLKHLARDRYVVVCVGGGVQINRALKEHGYVLRKHGPLGRELETLEERQLARDALEKNAVDFQKELVRRGIPIRVEIPVDYIGGVLCHRNGDDMARAAYNGYDVIYVTTTMRRIAKKKAQFAELPKIQIKGFRPKKR